MERDPPLGAYLKHCREARGLSLDDLSRATRVRSRYLLALEEDRLNALPAPVFVRGYIRAYCASVGEAPGQPLRLYEAGLRSARPAPLPPPPPARAGIGRRAALPALVAAALLLLGGALYLFANPSAPEPSSGEARGTGPTASR